MVYSLHERVCWPHRHEIIRAGDINASAASRDATNGGPGPNWKRKKKKKKSESPRFKLKYCYCFNANIAMFQDSCRHAHRRYGAVRPPPKFQRRYETAKIIINNNNNAYEDDNKTIIKFNGTLFVARPLFRSILSTFGVSETIAACAIIIIMIISKKLVGYGNNCKWVWFPYGNIFLV